MENTPKNIFELINLNIVDLSKDLVALANKVNEIHAALYPANSPNESGE
jgi:hypothetical protein